MAWLVIEGQWPLYASGKLEINVHQKFGFAYFFLQTVTRGCCHHWGSKDNIENFNIPSSLSAISRFGGYWDPEEHNSLWSWNVGYLFFKFMQEEICPMAGMQEKNLKWQAGSGKCRDIIRKAEFCYKNEGTSLGLSYFGLEKVLLTHYFQIHSQLVYGSALLVGYASYEKETRQTAYWPREMARKMVFGLSPCWENKQKLNTKNQTSLTN